MHPYQYLLFGVRMPGADHPPGFMTVLARFSWLGFRSFFQHQVISCVIGATGVAAMGVAGRRIAGERVGLIVAILAALSPNLFYFDAMVVSESMMVATTAAILWAVYRWWDRPSVRSAAVFGLVIGVAALVRSESILLGPLLAVPLVWWRVRRAAGRRDRPRRRRVGPAPRSDGWRPSSGLAGLVAVVVVAPWVGYNMSRFEEPTTLSAQLDQTFGTANCESVYEGDRVGYWSLSCIQETEHLVPEGDASAQGKGFREIAFRTPATTATACRTSSRPGWGGRSACTSPRSSCCSTRSVDQKEIVLGQIGMVAWYGIAVAGAFGLIGLRRAGRPIFPIVAIVGSVVVVVALVYGNTRFRLPAELALMIPAAVSLDAALAGMRRRWDAWNAERRALGAAAIANPPAPDTEDAGADDGDDGHPDAEDASGDTAADPPGGLGSSSGRFSGLRRPAGTRRAGRAGHARRAEGRVHHPRRHRQLPGPARRRRGHLLRAVGLPALPAVRRPPPRRIAPGSTPSPTCATAPCASTPPTGWRSRCSSWSSTSAAATRSRACGTSSRTTACCRATRPTPPSAGCSRPGR